MSNNGPISVSAPGTDLRTATGKDVILNTRYPFAKLDSTNLVSFQSIEISFANDPPNPDGSTSDNLTTLIYKFPHGYKYTPTVWCMFQRTVGAGDQGDLTVTKFGPYQYESGVIAVSSASDLANYATLELAADDTNIYLGVMKVNVGAFGPDPPVNIAGYTLLVRVYVFVEDLLGTDVPNQA